MHPTIVRPRAPHSCPFIDRLEPRRLLCGTAGAHGGDALSVATYNLYVGADIIPPIAAIGSGDGQAIVTAVTSFWQGVKATDLHARAAAIAKQIDTKDPAIVGLQEVASYFVGPSDPLTKAGTPLLDFEQELLAALSARKLHYAVVSRGTNADVEFPGFIDANPGLDDLRLVDHDVILARTDLPKSKLKLTDSDEGSFVTNLQFPTPAGPATIERGWVSIDAKVDGKKVRVIDTHLEPYVAAIREAQAAEIVAGPADTTLPVILLGDLNVSPDGSLGTTYADLKVAGFADAWLEVHPKRDGFTDGQDADLANPVSKLFERIDFVLLKGDLVGKKADVIGEELKDRTPSGLWPSDHAGVSATIVISPHHKHGWVSMGHKFSDSPIKEDRALDELLA